MFCRYLGFTSNNQHDPSKTISPKLTGKDFMLKE